MYQQYPTPGQPPDSARPPLPSSLRTAVRLMWAGAVVSGLSLILNLATLGTLRTSLRRNDPSLTAAQIHNFEVYIVAVPAVTLALWIWMALANRAGKGWARIAGTVLFGIATLLLAIGLALTGAGAGEAVFILTWLIGLGAVIMLWRRESSEFFAAQRERR